MDLSLATIDQIADELNRREIPFSLIVSAKSAEETHPEEAAGSCLPAPFVAVRARATSGALPARCLVDFRDDGRGS